MEVYVYSVRYFSDYESKWFSHSGVVCGSSIADAAEKLESFFDDIEEMRIFVTEGSDSGVIGFDEVSAVINSNNLVCE